MPSRILARMVLALTDGIMLAWLVDRDDAATQAVLDAYTSVLVTIVRDAQRSGFLTLKDDAPGEAGESGDDGAGTDSDDDENRETQQA